MKHTYLEALKAQPGSHWQSKEGKQFKEFCSLIMPKFFSVLAKWRTLWKNTPLQHFSDIQIRKKSLGQALS